VEQKGRSVSLEDVLKLLGELKEMDRERRLAELEMLSGLLRDLAKERVEDSALTLPVTLASDGRITVPEAVREYLGVRQGDILVVKVVKVVRKSRLRPKQ